MGKLVGNPVAFVLNMNAVGLGVARSLGREGIPVVGVDFTDGAPGLSSRYCRPLLTPNPDKDPKGVLRVMLREGRKLSVKGVIYPTSDAYVLFVSRFRESLSKYFLFTLPPKQVLECIVNKRKQYGLMERSNVPYPLTHYPRSLDDLERLKDEIEYPSFVKPCYSHAWQTRLGNKGFKVNNATELMLRYKEALRAKLEVVVQSVIPGPNTNHVKVCAYLSKNGRVLASFVTRKIRQHPAEFGVGTLMESVHYDALLQLGLRFFRNIGYRGIGSIEFKKDDRNGEYKLLELNPRFWVQNIQASFAGANFPLIQYADLTRQLLDPVTDFRDGVTWLDALSDIAAFLENRKLGRLTFASWLRSIRGVDCHAFFARDDPMPFLKQYWSKAVELPRIVRQIRALL